MGVNKKTDGRYIVGMGAPNENEYKGSQGWRDIFIQLTENGATPDSEEKLAFLRDYAIYHNSEGNAIMPPSVSVWVSNNGVTSAVNADDISLDGDTYTICGIKWDGSSWDYSNAGQSSGGGGGSSLPSYTSSDVGKVLTVGEGELVETVIVPEQAVTITAEMPFSVLTGTVDSALQNIREGSIATAVINGTTYQAIGIVQGGGELTAYSVSELHALFTYASQFGGAMFGIEEEEPVGGTYTVSLKAAIPSVAPIWETPDAGGAFPQFFIVPNDDPMTSAKLTNPDGTTVDGSIPSGRYYCGFNGTIFPIRIVNNGITGGFVEGGSIEMHVSANMLTAIGFMQDFNHVPFGSVSNLTVTNVNYTLTPAT